MPTNEAIRIANESHICHCAMSNGIRAIITMGDVNGIIDIHITAVELGSWKAIMPNTRPNMMGSVAIVVRLEASWALSTLAPMAAKMEA